MTIKIIGSGFYYPKPTAYMHSRWNNLDLFIVSTGWMNKLHLYKGSLNLDSLRALRILKPLETISKTPKLKIIMFAMINAIPHLIDIFLIIIFGLII